jgi:GTP-dependent phosphoenolpyruvate carboxykinase
MLEVDREEWQAEVEEHESFFGQFGNHLPEELRRELEALEKRLGTP